MPSCNQRRCTPGGQIRLSKSMSNTRHMWLQNHLFQRHIIAVFIMYIRPTHLLSMRTFCIAFLHLYTAFRTSQIGSPVASTVLASRKATVPKSALILVMCRIEQITFVIGLNMAHVPHKRTLIFENMAFETSFPVWRVQHRKDPV
jgi:hypothetical protein